MANSLTSTGLTTATQAELFATLSTNLKAIYGNDINLDASTPDAQMLYIFIQSVLDNLDLIKQIYTSFDPDQAIGVTLDQRAAINGIQRQSGTYTITNVTIVATQAVNLYGLDQTLQQVFTVSDTAGTKWYLVTTQSISGSGTYVYSFRAANSGKILTVPNTITIPSTIVIGVSTVNNPTTYTTLGIDEETDASLRLRRQKSVALASQGYLAGLQAAIQNITGVTYTKIYENRTDTIDSDSTPGHCIWPVIGGTAAAVDIATAIYKKRNAGCNMRGSQSYVITQIDGSPFTVNWDSVVIDNVWIKFNVTPLDGVTAPNTALMLTNIPLLYVPTVYEKLNSNKLDTIIQSIDPNALVSGASFSTSLGGTYTTTLLPSAKNRSFTITSANIVITVI